MTVRARASRGLRIAGLTPFSTIDWPGHMAATLFLQGCPWDCFYCHNPALMDPRAPSALSWNDVTRFLSERVGLLDAVVFSGGEPTMQRALIPAMDAVRDLGFKIGLHSAGAFPGLLARALPHADWIGLDIKASPESYAGVTGREGSGDLAWRSLQLVLADRLLRAGSDRPLDYEVRTTVHPSAIDDDGLHRLGLRLAEAGVETWAVQRFRETGARAPLPRVHAPTRDLALDRLPTERFARVTVR